MEKYTITEIRNASEWDTLILLLQGCIHGGGGRLGISPPPPNLQTYTSGWIMIEVALQKLMFMVAKISV